MSDLRVLCVESQPAHLDALRTMLETAGYEVMPATTAGQALRALSNLPIDGVLLEYDLPDANGSAVRTQLKQIKPHVPVLLFTGVGIQTPFLLRFFDSYLRKPDRQRGIHADLDE